MHASFGGGAAWPAGWSCRSSCKTMVILCLACGRDLTSLPKDRRSFSRDSRGAAEPREQALSAWSERMERELLRHHKSFSAVFSEPCNAGKVCRKCFDDLIKYFKLKANLVEKIHAAAQSIIVPSQPCKQTVGIILFTH